MVSPEKEGCVVGVHHTMDETNLHQHDQRRLMFRDGLKQRQVWSLNFSRAGEMAINRVVGKAPHGFYVAARGNTGRSRRGCDLTRCA